MIKKKIKILFVNFLILLLGIFAIELFFGGWVSKKNNLNNLNIIVDKQISYKTNLYSKDFINIKYSRDKFGFRGKYIFNQPDKIDLLTVGGSTTDQRYITDGKTWQDILENLIHTEKNTNFYVANAGVDGHSTFGHLKSFDLWFSGISNLKPKYIMFFIGINDLFNIGYESQYDNILNESFRNKSIIYNIFRKIRGAITYNNITVSNQSKFNKSDIKYCIEKIANKEFYKYFDKNLILFKKRLEQLINKCEKLHSTPIFVTQPSFICKVDSDKNILGVCDSFKIHNVNINGVDYSELINKINTTIFSVCGNKYQVIDLTNNTNWEKDDFYDFIHYTPKGSYKLGKLIYQKIKLR